MVKMNVDTDTQWTYWEGIKNFYQVFTLLDEHVLLYCINTVYERLLFFSLVLGCCVRAVSSI